MSDELEKEQYGGDHHVSFSFLDTWDTPIKLKATVTVEWYKYKEIAEQLQKRIAELEAQLRWIPVSERLPKNGIEVLGFLKHEDYWSWDIVAYYVDEGVWSADDHVLIKGAVTHWRPLPEPPEVQQ